MRPTRGTPEGHQTPPDLLDVRAVAARCSCSARHIHRLRDSGRMPAPIRLGALVRWDRSTIERWIAEGCPASRVIARDGRSRS